jgi:hypothetical protein
MPELSPFIESEQYQQVPDPTTSGDSTKFVTVPKSTPYEILGISPNSTEEDIVKGYRTTAKRYNVQLGSAAGVTYDARGDLGDIELKKELETKNLNKQAWFKLADEAYKVLSDPKTKELYDKYGWASAKKGTESKPKFELGKTAEKFFTQDKQTEDKKVITSSSMYGDTMAWNFPISVQNLPPESRERIIKSLNEYDTEKVCHCERPVFRLQSRKGEPKDYCIVCHKPVVEGLSGPEKPESREGFKQLGSDVKRLPGSSRIE